MLEFVLMLPVLLLLFGITLLTYDTLDGKLYLQQANRLLAWDISDRNVGKSGLSAFNARVVSAAKQPFNARNAIENALDSSAGDMWGFGSDEKMWGRVVERKKTQDGRVFIGETPWAVLGAGNMELEMKKVSSAYLGLLGVSSVLQANGENVEEGITATGFDLTHTVNPPDGDISVDFSPEALVVRRYSEEHDNRNRNYRSTIWQIVSQRWPVFDDDEPTAVGRDDEPDVQDYNRRLFDYAQ